MNDDLYLSLARQVINDNYRVCNQLYKEILSNINAFLNSPEIKAILETLENKSAKTSSPKRHLRIVGKDEPFTP